MTQVNADDQLLAQYCELKLTGITTPFDSVSGLAVNIPLVSEIVKAASGPPIYKFRSTVPAYGDLTCMAGLSKTDKSLFTWWDEIAQGKREPKDGTLSVLDTTKAPKATWSITGALLTRLDISPMDMGEPKLATVTATFNCVSYKRMK
jgi:hypothetical protein